MILLEKNSKNLITDSATQGLFLILNSIKNSNNVILHPNTCLHVYMAALHARKKIHFVDIDTKTCNFKKEDLQKTIKTIKENEKDTPIVVIVHLYGITCPLNIINICRAQNSIIIEDCAQALFSFYSDKSAVGSKGDFSIFSFGETKHLDLGSSGAIVCRDESKYYELRNSLLSLRLNKSFKPNANKNYKSDYYKFMQDKISHKVCANNKSNFENFIIFYSKIFSEGLIENKYNWEELKDMILKIKKETKKIADKEKIIERRLKKYPINFFKKQSEYIYWRFSFLVNPSVRKNLISTIRIKFPQISSWYPSIPYMINQNSNNEYNGSKELSNCICNIDSINLTHAKLNKILDLIEDFY